MLLCVQCNDNPTGQEVQVASSDLGRICLGSDDHEPPMFPAACASLRRAIEQAAARLVILDPFFAFLGPDIGSLNDLMVRRALAPLARVAAATQAAFLLIRHLSKVR